MAKAPILTPAQKAAARLAAEQARDAESVKPNAAQEQKRGNTDKVVVCCSVPTGMILRLFAMKPTQELVMGGGYRDVMRAELMPGARIRVNGPATPWGKIPTWRIEGSYALTENVDRNFWAEWVKQNDQHSAVTNEVIFAENDMASAVARCRENAARRSGLQPMDPDKDPRVPKPLNPNLTQVETEEERKKSMGKAVAA
jgi:hypothetical protein